MGGKRESFSGKLGYKVGIKRQESEKTVSESHVQIQNVFEQILLRCKVEVRLTSFVPA